MLYTLRRAEIAEIADILADALDEDRRVNADMFDTSSRRITGNRHPNATMRALEERLAGTDADLLCLLAAMLTLGMEISLGLSYFASREEFLSVLESEYRSFEMRFSGAAALASDVTAPKAQHLLRRLRIAMEHMEQS